MTPENEDEDHECAVCFESLANDKDDLLRILRICGHTFCKNCLTSIQKVRHSSIRCPLCRAPFSKEDIIKPSLVKETVESKDLTTDSHKSSSGSASSVPNELPVKIRALLPEIHKLSQRAKRL